MEKERNILLEHLNSDLIKPDLTHIFKHLDIKNPKSEEASDDFRNKGNDLFLLSREHDAETHEGIFSHYCRSIALAPIDSQALAFSYGNRSYLLLHMHKYEECIKDIDRAMKMSIPDVLKAKLLCHKAGCLKNLGSNDISSILEMIENLIEKIEGEDKINLQKMFDAVKVLTVDKKTVEASIQDESIISDDLPVTDDYSSCVSIEYNEKYGRHLVAVKDYNPGDIIFVEKIYASAFNEGASVVACAHCLKHTWSGIPCEFCDWSMYCSESCKETAWNEYHDIECAIITHLREFYKVAWKLVVLPLRILIMGIKETGGIENLKKEIELLDQRADDASKDLLKNDQLGINNIQNVYLLDSYMPVDVLMKISSTVPPVLISLTKCSKLKDHFTEQIKQIEDLAGNEDVMFLGSLLIKIMGVLNSNVFASGFDEFTVKTNPLEIVHFDEKRCLSILFSLINHSCFPAADWRCAEPNKLFVYALQPIKKGSQIFVSYRYNFESEVLTIRQQEIFRKYNFKCDCRACTEAWPPIEIGVAAAAIDEEKQEDDVINDFRDRKIFVEDFEEVVATIEKGGRVNGTHIKKLSLLIAQGMHWKQPSQFLCNLTNFLRMIFTTIYSPKSLIFNKCE